MSSKMYSAATCTWLQHHKQLQLARPAPFAEVGSFSGCIQLEPYDPGVMVEGCLRSSLIIPCNQAWVVSYSSSSTTSGACSRQALSRIVGALVGPKGELKG